MACIAIYRCQQHSSRVEFVTAEYGTSLAIHRYCVGNSSLFCCTLHYGLVECVFFRWFQSSLGCELVSSSRFDSGSPAFVLFALHSIASTSMVGPVLRRISIELRDIVPMRASIRFDPSHRIHRYAIPSRSEIITPIYLPRHLSDPPARLRSTFSAATDSRAPAERRTSPPRETSACSPAAWIPAYRPPASDRGTSLSRS